MPIMTDHETGETKEISMEEFMAAMQGGIISMRQEVRHADGTVTSSLIYGNDIGDGVDRSLNIFGTIGDVLFYAVLKARKIKEADENAEKLFFIDNSDADYEVTIDDTQSPMMHIITCTKEKVRVARYIRDERKSVGKPILEAEYSFVNGKISATLEDVREGDGLLMFACGVYEIRKLLDQRGLLQKLKELENRSSGVMVTKDGDEVEDESGIKTKIVRGHNRPDLPCMMFGGLFGQNIEDAVMMRPYMDELMGETLHAGMSWEDKIKAAEEGDPDLMEDLAQAYLDGDEVETDFKKAVYWFEKLAETGCSSAMFNMGLHYAKGCGVERDFDKAASWMKKAADNGDTDAPFLLEKYNKAAKATKQIAKGDAQAQADLAEVLMSLARSLEQAGSGNDYKEAFELAKKSAAQNNPDGFWILALAYEHGRGTRKNVKKAIECYQNGAELGHAPSQHSLGCYYMRGDNLEQDDKKAFDLFLKSAEQGYGFAMADVGRCYQFAKGVDCDMKKAIEWYEKALEVIDDPELEQKIAIFKILEGKEDGEFPYAEPNEGQHTHLDFQNRTKGMLPILGTSVVNQTGTEYAFLSISDIAEDANPGEYSKIMKEIAKADSGKFDLVETAHDMAELFRVSAEAFDLGEDREQDILNGLIRRASIYNKFRSFAWTFTAYCDQNNLKPETVDFATIQDMVDYIESLKCLNYTGNSYSPTICTGDDIHIYYVPDSILNENRDKILNIINGGADADSDAAQSQTDTIQSLDKLREELSYMYPAIRAIYDALEADRDRDEALEGGASDILYAWCSMTYAAREPIFSEDGPVNCFWEHPEDGTDWEKKFRIDILEQQIDQGKKWMKQHKQELSEAKITVKGKTFVFSGVETMDEWDEILEKLTKLGGIRRTAVSGKTDYLVCNPGTASDSKLSKAKEQNAKGKNVKIVLLAEFLKAIKMKISSPEEKIAQLKGEESKSKKPAEKHLKPVDRPAISSSVATDVEIPAFTYEKGLKVKGSGYEMDIPDGFVIKTGEEGQDFIAYIPNEEEPDSYIDSPFIIFAGQRLDNDNISEMKTAAEFGFLGDQMYSHLNGTYVSSDSIRYERRDLPGFIMYVFELGYLHSHVSVGVDEHMQMMSFQIGGVNRHNLKTYKKKVVGLMDHMRADKPVRLLKELDDKEFIDMSASTMRSKAIKEWTDLLRDYTFRLKNVCNSEVQAITGEFKENGDGDLSKYKRDIKAALTRTIAYIDEVLLTAEAVYTLKRVEYPEGKALEKMKKAIEETIASSEHEVTLNGEPFVRVTSKVAGEIAARISMPVYDVIDKISGNQCTLKDATKNALLRIKEEKTEEIRAEKIAREKVEAERIAQEKAEAKRKKLEREAEKKEKYDSAMALAANPYSDNIESAIRILESIGRKKYSDEIDWCNEKLKLAKEKEKLEKKLKKENLEYKLKNSKQLKELDKKKKEKQNEIEETKKYLELKISVGRILLLTAVFMTIGVLSMAMALDEGSTFMGLLGIFLIWGGSRLIYYIFQTRENRSKKQKQLQDAEILLVELNKRIEDIRKEIEAAHDEKVGEQIKAEIEEIEAKLKEAYMG